ncbi:MAG: isoprenylcysteine carboxylmethyltransferase family protein [Pseudomonadota bacterium]
MDALDLPPVWTVLFGMIAFGLSSILPIWTFAFGPGLGVGLMLAGVALIVWAAIWFRRMGTPIEPRNTPSALLVEGPYRLNRNPIYTGMTVVLIGWALILGTLSALILALLFPLIMTYRFVLGEEEGLRQTFGAKAEAYFARTRRW